MKKCGVTNGMVKLEMMNLATIYITFNLCCSNCSQIVNVLKDVAKIELYSWMWTQIGLSFTCSQIVSVLKDVVKIELYSWMWTQIGLSFTCVNGKTFTISFLLSSCVCMGVDIVYKL
jgi:hypothetical protein